MPNPMYDVVAYGHMMADSIRMDAYEASIRRACRPGCRVLDLGAGTGIMSLLACRHGAGHVYAIEPSDAITLARALADANGVTSRITFLQGMSTQITLPEPIDVIVADVRGVLPLTGTSIATMMDARRFLAPDGVIIPARDRVRGALVEAERASGELLDPWRKGARGFDTSPAERLIVNAVRRIDVTKEALLTTPGDLLLVDYASVDAVNAVGTSVVEATRSGVAHGLVAWFDTVLTGDIGFSNEPGHPRLIYGQYFFPLAQAMTVAEGDRATVMLRASQVHDDYVWSWSVTLEDAQGVVKARAAQSTFDSAPLSLERLKRTDRAARPRLTPEGQIDRLILERANGETTLGEIADDLVQRFPTRFANDRQALNHVAELMAGRVVD